MAKPGPEADRRAGFLGHLRPDRHSTAWRLVRLALLVVLAGCAVGRPTQSQAPPRGGTGFRIGSEFETYYRQHGGLTIFGYPIGDPYPDLENGQLIQYFQRMRLERDPDSGQVRLTELGDWAIPDEFRQKPEPEAADPASNDPSKGIAVDGAFLAFYELHGGESFFGPPLSTEMDEGGRRVQYFQNARLEWQPDAPLDFRVQVAYLGEAHYRHEGIFRDPGRSRPLDSAAIGEAVVRANLRAPILFAGDEQVVFVDVETPEGGHPIAGVSVALTVQYNGKTEVRELDLTDNDGHTRTNLLLEDPRPGQRVEVTITAINANGDEIGAAAQAFKVWW